jgi:hypothetical protein
MASRPEPPAPPPEISEDGVDLTLIRAFLDLSPAERLAVVEDRQDDLERIREHRRRTGCKGGRRGRPD